MKTLTKTTHIGQVRQANLTQIERVCELLGWTREQYCAQQYEVYEAYVARLCRGLPKAADYLRYSPVFRGWFNHEWMLRTALEFLPYAEKMCEDVCEVDISGELIYDEGLASGDVMLMQEYLFIHDARRLYYDEAMGRSYVGLKV